MQLSKKFGLNVKKKQKPFEISENLANFGWICKDKKYH